LLEQNRARWDHGQIRRGLLGLARAESLLALTSQSPGRYVLQAALAACHARARTADETDWRRIADLYGTLMAQAPSPVVELNRAVAIAMADGPAAGLALVDALDRAGLLATYPLLYGVRGDLLMKVGRNAEAAAALEQAADLTKNARERRFLLAKAAKAMAADRE
jgi:predicted RNA polymerase sigma factor